MAVRAWIYIGTILLTPVLLAGLTVAPAPLALSDLVTFGVFTVLATVAHLKRAEGTSHMVLQPSPVFFVAGMLLLPAFPFVLLVIISHLVEWIIAQRQPGKHLHAWYIQPFNIAMHITGGCIGALLYTWLTGTAVLDHHLPTTLWSGAVAAGVYYLVTETLLGGALMLARGKRWRDLGLFTLDKLLPEVIMVCLGLTVAVSWQVHPWLIVPALTPLLAMYRALTIPQLKQEAQTDGKTGLLNARYFASKFGEELDRAKRFNRPLAVIMADLDYLRTINNTYGHLAGDVVLTGIADIIRTTMRDYDLAGRFGGEEFCIVLPETDTADATVIAERLRTAIETARFAVTTTPDPIGATMSLGIASYPADGETATALTHEADVAVYQAKLQGRNRVVCALDVPHAVKLEAATKGMSAAPATTGGTLPVPPSTETSGTPAVMPPTPAATMPQVATGEGTPRHAAPSHTAGEGGDDPRHADQPGASTVPVARARHRHGASPSTAPSTWLFRTFVASVILLGVGVGVVGSVAAAWLTPLDLVLLVALMVLAERFQVNVYGDNSFSVGVAVIVAAALIGGFPGVVCVSAANALAAHVQQRRGFGGLYKAAFNWATHVLAGAIPVLVFAGQTVSLQMTNLLGLTLLAAVAGFLYYLVDSVLISTVISLSKGSRISTTWRAQFEWLAGYYVVLAVLGLFIGVAHVALGPVGLVVFTLPLGMMQYAQQQYVRKTETGVRELKRMNTELRHANTEVVGASGAIQRLNHELKELNDELFITLGTLLDLRDPYVSGHSAQVARYAVLLARELGLPTERVAIVRQAGYLHDIGKIAITEQVLLKPGKLTADEFEYMKTHATIGGELLASTQGLQHIAPFVRAHHERWDGRGYPDGLAGEQIPLEARILNVCDSVEAMASDRPYHHPLPVDAILAEVQRCAGTQFDPAVAAAFVRIAERDGLSWVVNSAQDVGRRQLHQLHQLVNQKRMLVDA